MRRLAAIVGLSVFVAFLITGDFPGASVVLAASALIFWATGR